MKQLQNESGRALVLAIGVIVLMLVLTTTVLLAANTGTKNTEHRESSMKSVKNAELGLERLTTELEEQTNALMHKKRGTDKGKKIKETDFGKELEKILKENYSETKTPIKKGEGDDFVYRAFVKDVKPGYRLGSTNNEHHPGRKIATIVSYGKDKGVIKKVETSIELGMVNYPSMFNYVLSSNYRLNAYNKDQLEEDTKLKPGINYVEEPNEKNKVIRQGNVYLLGGPDIMGNVRISNSLMYNPYSFHFTYANPAEWGGGNLIYGGNPHWWNFGEDFKGLLGYKSYRYYYQRDGKKFEKDNIKKEDAFIKANEIEGMTSDQKGIFKYTRDKYSYRALLQANKLLEKDVNQQRFREQSPSDIFAQSNYKDLASNGRLTVAEDDTIENKKITKGITDIIDGEKARGIPLVNDPNNFNFYEPKIDLFAPDAYNKDFSLEGRKDAKTNPSLCVKYGSDGNCVHYNSRKNLDLVIEEETEDGKENTKENRLEAIRSSSEELKKEIERVISPEELQEANTTYNEVSLYINGEKDKPGRNPESFKKGSTTVGNLIFKQDEDITYKMYHLIVFAADTKEYKEELKKLAKEHNRRIEEATKEIEEEKKNNKGFIGFFQNIGLAIESNKINKEKIKIEDIGKGSGIDKLLENIEENIGVCQPVEEDTNVKEEKDTVVTDGVKQVTCKVTENESNKNKWYLRVPSELRKDIENRYNKQASTPGEFYFIDKRRIISKKLLTNQLNSIVVAPRSAKNAGEVQRDEVSGEKNAVLNYDKYDMVFGWNTRLARRVVNANSYANGEINFKRAYFGPPQNLADKDNSTDKYPNRRLVIGYPNLAQIHNNITLNGALFVDGDVRIRKATLNGRFLMYVDGDVEIDHSHFGYPNGHKADGQIYNKDDAMFIFATGNVKIKNISHHRDKPSVFRGFIYAGGDLEIHGGDTNLNIIGGISGRDVFLSSLRGQNYPVIKVNSKEKGVENYGVESFTAPTDQNKHLGRVRLIHDETIGEEYVKLMKQYGVEDKNIFEIESVPTGERDLSTIGSYEDMLEDIKKSTKK